LVDLALALLQSDLVSRTELEIIFAYRISTQNEDKITSLSLENARVDVEL
jgi:hypothetical protein